MDFHLIGYDYTNLISKAVAIDPTTKALLTKEVGDLYVKIAGDTMTGLLTLSGVPSVDLHAATKKYVDDHMIGGITNASGYDTVQLAIDAANSAGNKFVWLPAGTYDIAAPLSFPADGFSLIGAGRKIVTLRATSSIDAVIKQTQKRYLTVGGFRIDGNGDLASKGIWLENVVWFSKFFDIDITDIATSALYLANAGDTIGYAPYWNLFQNIQCGRVAGRGTHGVHLRGDVNLNTFINCTAAGDDFGILLQNYDFGASGVRGPQSNLFFAPDCGGSATCIGVKIESSANLNTFINPYIESVNRSMVILEKSNTVINGMFYGNTNDEILAPNGLDCYYYKVGATTYGSWKGAGGAGNLSDLIIDVNKDWNAKNITNMGTIEHKGATLKSGIQTEGRCSNYQRDGVAWSGGETSYAYAVFREKMTNTPSSITLSDAAETENWSISQVAAERITVYGFNFVIWCAGGSSAFCCGSKKYLTVGN